MPDHPAPANGAPVLPAGAPTYVSHDARLLAALRHRIRVQLAGAVTDGRLDGDVANGILVACGLDELPRRYSVRLSLTFVGEVTAGTPEDAFDAAEDAITAALNRAPFPVEVDIDARHDHHAAAGGIDHDALTSPPS